MKKIILLTSALVITGSAILAQKTTFGIKGGLQQSALKMSAEVGDVNYSTESPRIGFLFGGVADIKFSSHFSVQPNLLLVYKPSQLLALDGQLNTMSIDVPINLLYNYNGFFIGAGPNLSYGISSKLKPFDDADEDMDLYEEIDGEDALLNRFEIGANAIMGFQFPSGLAITANYTRGFNNLINTEEPEDNTKLNYKQFGVSLSYMFNQKKK